VTPWTLPKECGRIYDHLLVATIQPQSKSEHVPPKEEGKKNTKKMFVDAG
jgi:hypothetical protein